MNRTVFILLTRGGRACIFIIEMNGEKSAITATGTMDRYAEFWSAGLQSIEELHQEILKCLRLLEQSHGGFETVYDDLIRHIDELSSLYSGSNTIEGGEHVQRLRAIVKRYGKNRENGIANLELLDSLMRKIKEQRDRSFEEFPLLSHHEISGDARSVKIPDPADYPYAWVTFEQGGSWFITSCRDLKVLEPGDFRVLSWEDDGSLIVSYNQGVSVIKNLLRKSAPPERKRFRILVLDHGRASHRADRMGRTIYAKRDFVKPMILPFSGDRTFCASPGRVRLFGVRHIYLS